MRTQIDDLVPVQFDKRIVSSWTEQDARKLLNDNVDGGHWSLLDIEETSAAITYTFKRIS